MPGAPRTIAIVWLSIALAAPLARPAEPGAPSARAERLLRASQAERRRLLSAPEFATAGVAQALLEAGEKAAAAAEFSRAVSAFQAAEVIARGAKADKDLARALTGAAGVLYGQGELARAERAIREALGLWDALGDVAQQAEAWNIVGFILHARADYPAALTAYGKAVDLWKATGNRLGAARAANNIGNVQRALWQLDAAQGSYEQALRTLEDLGDRRRAAVVTNNLGIVHFYRGEYAEALERVSRSLAVNEELGDRLQIAKNLDTLGLIHRAGGAYARALECFRRSLRISQQLGSKFQVLETWNNIGLVHFSQGDYRLAIDAYKRGLRLNSTMGGTTLVPEGLYNIAAAAWRLGDRPRARANYRELLRVTRGAASNGYAAAALHDLGRMALEEGRHGDARGLLQRSLEMREALKDKAGIAETLDGMAALQLALGRPSEALELADRATGIARTYEQAEQLWEALTLSGMAERRLGRLDAARRSLQEAMAAIEGLRLQVAGRGEGGERFFESKLSPYHELIALATAAGAPADALAMAERAKARALADLVQAGRVDVSGVMSGEERREEGRLRAALASLNRSIQAEREKDPPDAGRLASLEAERASARSAYETFESAAYARYPGLQVRRGGATPFTLPEADALLPDRSVALMEYAVTEEGSYLFVLTREDGGPRLQSYRLAAGRGVLAPLARRLRERLAERDLGYGEDARRLYELLIAPARASLQGRTHLVIVPDGPLWDVPFQALQEASGRYVVESAAVSYAPSLTVLRETLRRPAASGRPLTLLAMGKANFGGQAAAPAALTLMSSLDPLPDAERQVRQIGALYGPERSATWLGAEAREDRFKAEAPHYSVLHLATHGVLDESSPLYSHVVLSPGSGSSDDGLLEAWEVLDLKLDADLVVLSACETGRGRIAPGEGIVGTMWAFFVAGSRAVLVSQWKVESTSTTELMTAFHRGLVRETGGKAEHLRRASLELLRTPRYAHPFYWAGFVLVGNPY